MSEPKDRAEAKKRRKKPRGYPKFESLLKRIISSPPMHKRTS
jgi:hypothetical protein